MAIGRTIRPHILVVGTVERVRPLTKKADGALYAHEVTVTQDHGAQAAYRLYSGDTAPAAPSIGDYVVVEASLEESRDFGASLNFERFAFDALDRITSAMSAMKPKAA